ncbi:TRAP transporter small permease subunit [Ahrensia sp. 13_GOM-1096m]|uniref:TRAP transporter small permease subunit n=1 Tax=Ahrensia sp. 13_GOM-1096m TaxID=1380380 RepID=UPI0006891909|nr:TRAP transporter small permease subunit [Ahrensia sp. 13_GOM-1096m]
MSLSHITRILDQIVRIVAMIGCTAIIVLVIVTVYDVLTRYFGVPKVFGLNSTQLQESQYWAHATLFAFVMAWAYTKQTHVRIDLVRDLFGRRAKYVIEMVCILIFLMPFATISGVYSWQYAVRSFASGEVSASTIGLTNLWLLKSTLVVMFAMLTLAGISHFLKCVDGLLGNHDDDPTAVSNAIGGGH